MRQQQPLCHTDEFVSPSYEIATGSVPYGKVHKSSDVEKIWDGHSTHTRFIGLSIILHSNVLQDIEVYHTLTIHRTFGYFIAERFICHSDMYAVIFLFIQLFPFHKATHAIQIFYTIIFAGYSDIYMLSLYKLFGYLTVLRVIQLYLYPNVLLAVPITYTLTFFKSFRYANPSPSGHNGRHFTNDIFKCISWKVLYFD